MHETSESDSRQKWLTGRRHTPRKTNVKATHAVTTESDARYEVKWRMIPTMKSSLKATHAMKGNSKEVSQPGERLPEHKEGKRQEPRPCSATKAATAQRRKYICPLGS